MLADSYGRVATDLRVSLTDRCNLRCTYCMPPEGPDWLPAAPLLTDDELLRLDGLRVGRLLITGSELARREPDGSLLTHADLADRDLVIEAITEDLDAKLAMWREVDSVVKPEAFFATNTSSLAVADQAAATSRAAGGRAWTT